MSAHGAETGGGGGHETKGGENKFLKRFFKEFSPVLLATSMLFSMFDRKGVEEFLTFDKANIVGGVFGSVVLGGGVGGGKAAPVHA